MACSWFDLACKVKAAATDAAVDAGSQSLQTLADQVTASAAAVFGALGTLWVFTPTPRLDGNSSQGAGSPLPGELVDVLGYVQWIGLITAVLALIALGALLGWRTRSDTGEMLFPRLALIAGGVLVLGSASALVGALVGGAGERTSATVAFLRGELVSLTLWAAVLATIIAGIRLIHGNAKAGVNWLQGMMTLLLVSAASAGIAQALVGAMDDLSIRIINNSLECSVSDPNCFGSTLVKLMQVASNAATPGSPSGGIILAIIIGVIGLILSFIQMLLMIMRGGMLIVLVGVLPLTASATTTEMGRQWFQRSTGWLIAWALYKPAAAIIYAGGFQLAGSLGKDNSGIWSAVSGLALIVASVVALPALLRFVVPVTAAVTGSGGSGAAAAGMAMTGVAQGAVQMKSQGTTSPGGGSSAPPAPAAAPAGADRPPNGSRGAAPAPSTTVKVGPSGAGAVASQSGAGAGASAGAAAAGGGAAAAAGPVGVGVAAAGAAIQGAKKISNEAGGAE